VAELSPPATSKPPEPKNNSTAPLSLFALFPVDITIFPDDPHEVDPVRNDRVPLDPASPAFAVEMKMVPELFGALVPLDMLTSPPVLILSVPAPTELKPPKVPVPP
jgi:hypothetical protein